MNHGYEMDVGDDAKALVNQDYIDKHLKLFEESIRHSFKEREDKLKKENEVLREAVKAVSAKKTMTVYSHSEEFMDGANTAFAQAAEIADEALEQADKIREGK